MRIRCEFKADSIPVAYQMFMVSMIKEALKEVDLHYYEQLYNFIDKKKNKKSKNFTFGVYIKDYKIQKDIINVSDKVIVTFSSPDYEFMVNLYNGITKKKVFNYKGNFTMTNTKIYMLPEKKIEESEIIFSTLSPIAIRNQEGRFLNIDDKEYINELNYISNILIKSYTGYGLKQPLEFIPISLKKVVVKEEITGFKEKSNNKYLFINSYKGMFRLKGDKEDLNLIYQLGFGFKRNQGFGMLDVVG